MLGTWPLADVAGGDQNVGQRIKARVLLERSVCLSLCSSIRLSVCVSNRRSVWRSVALIVICGWLKGPFRLGWYTRVQWWTPIQYECNVFVCCWPSRSQHVTSEQEETTPTDALYYWSPLSLIARTGTMQGKGTKERRRDKGKKRGRQDEWSKVGTKTGVEGQM